MNKRPVQITESTMKTLMKHSKDICDKCSLSGIVVVVGSMEYVVYEVKV